MPQASQETCELAEKYFGNIAEDTYALQYLLNERGFKMEPNGVLWSPHQLPWTEKDRVAINYLCDEWDYAYEGEIDDAPTHR